MRFAHSAIRGAAATSASALLLALLAGCSGGPDATDSGGAALAATASDGGTGRCVGCVWTWTTTRQTTSSPLRAVWASSPTDVYVAGDDMTILHSIDHGTSWQPVPVTGFSFPRDEVDIYAMWGSSAVDLYVVGSVGILHSTDGARTWQSVGPASPIGAALAPAGLGFRSIWGTSATDVYAAGGAVQIPSSPESEHEDVYHSADRGKTWTLLGKSGFTVGGAAHHAPSFGSSEGYVGSSPGYATGSAPLYDPGALTVESLWGSSATDLYAAEDTPLTPYRGTLLHSTDGVTWTPEQLPAGYLDIRGVWGSSASSVFAITSSSILEKVNGQWQVSDDYDQVINQGAPTLEGVGGTADDTYVVGNGIWDNPSISTNFDGLIVHGYWAPPKK